MYKSTSHSGKQKEMQHATSLQIFGTNDVKFLNERVIIYSSGSCRRFQLKTLSTTSSTNIPLIKRRCDAEMWGMKQNHARLQSHHILPFNASLPAPRGANPIHTPDERCRQPLKGATQDAPQGRDFNFTERKGNRWLEIGN